VEELLRQADQLIATQRPRAEVYTAMAWRDVNQLLERRKEILDRNVLFQWYIIKYNQLNIYSLRINYLIK